MKQKLVITYLKTQGYTLIRCNGGSHAIFSNGTNSLVLPLHKVISIGTLRDIFKRMYKTPQEANLQMRSFMNKCD